jgi:hypothetical protein
MSELLVCLVVPVPGFGFRETAVGEVHIVVLLNVCVVMRWYTKKDDPNQHRQSNNYEQYYFNLCHD